MTGLFGFYYTSSFTDLFLGYKKPNPKAIARMCSIYLAIVFILSQGFSIPYRKLI